MTPTFEIVQGDNLEVLERFREEGRKFDAVVADPPYCSGAMSPADIQRGGGVGKYCARKDLGNFSDAMSQRGFFWFTRAWMYSARELLNEVGYIFVFIDWRQLPTVSDAMQAADFVWRGISVWDKRNSRPNVGHISQTTEFIVWGTKNGEKSDKILHKGVFSCPSPKMQDRIHPTQKEPSVIAELLSILPDAASAVLDPFSGSGSTGIAALSRGLNYVGVERDPVYVEESRGRLAESLKTLEMTGTLIDKHRRQTESSLF